MRLQQLTTLLIHCSSSTTSCSPHINCLASLAQEKSKPLLKEADFPGEKREGVGCWSQRLQTCVLEILGVGIQLMQSERLA